jgi:hypothetical protein
LPRGVDRTWRIYSSLKNAHITAKAMFMNISSEKEGHGNAEINQQHLVCGEEVRVDLRTSDRIGH